MTQKLCSSSQSRELQKSEARILQKLNELQLEFQEGRRAAPAFSCVTQDSLDKEETWKNISLELQSAELGVDTISANQAYIRSWIDQVMLDDEEDKAGKLLYPNSSLTSRYRLF